ncbi:crAss001_48 related protein [Limosilactobacillus reuteri]|uniref:crAss001_48 related protein n=1 Tax=Limosilactobacillus reuteri TaxID=1598 RepID=UPI003F294DB8
MTSKRKVLQQLSKERKDLLGKIDRLAQFIVKEGPKLSSPLELTMLNTQLRSMQAYLEILDARIIYMRGEK